MKNLKILASAFALVGAIVVAFVSTTFAASPGQLAGGDNYVVKNVTQNGSYANAVSAVCNDTVQYSMQLSNTHFGALNNVTLKASLPNGGGTSTAVATTDLGGVSGTSDTASVSLPSGANQTLINGSTVLYDGNGAAIKTLPDTIVSGVNIGTLTGSTTEFVNFRVKVNCPVVPVDVCPNIPGVQETVPAGLVKDSYGNCVEKPKKDVCPNIDGIQATIPEGFEKDANGNCVKKVVVSTAECKATDVKISEGRKVTVTINTKVTNATIVGYKIDFGDGTTANSQTASHVYAKDGTYKIVGSIEVKFADGTTRTINADDCVKTITFKADEPPVVVPTPLTPVTPATPVVLPETGVGGIVAAFAAASGLGSLGFSLITRRNRV